MLIEYDADAANEPPEKDPFGQREREITAQRSSLLAALSEISAEIVQPERARHMYALLFGDPFPDPTKAQFRSVDLLYNYEDLPSPIDPNARRFGAVTCWSLSDAKTDQWRDAIDAWAPELKYQFKSEVEIDVVYDSDTRAGTYLVLYFNRIRAPGMARSADIAELIVQEIAPAISLVKQKLASLGIAANQATRVFWEREVGLSFSDPRP